MLKRSTLLIFSLFTIAAVAEDEFAKYKADSVKFIDERIAALQSHKTCVTNATDREALKKCHSAMRESHKGMKHDALEKRRNRLDKRLKRTEENK